MNAVLEGELLIGRPSLYTDELATTICDLLITGLSLRQICNMDGFPDRRTVIRWMDKDPTFATKCARAREEQADLMDDRVLEIINKCEDGKIDPKAASVAISGLQWRAAKLKPKKYGDSQRHEHTGEGGGPILLAPAERKAIIRELLQLTGVAPKPDGGT